MYLSTCFIIFTINKFTLIKVLLNSNMYNSEPKKTPKNMYALNSPLLNLKIEYKRINPVKIQKNTSCKFVPKFDVLNDFRIILKMSNRIPIINPLSIKIKNIHA